MQGRGGLRGLPAVTPRRTPTMAFTDFGKVGEELRRRQARL